MERKIEEDACGGEGYTRRHQSQAENGKRSAFSRRDARPGYGEDADVDDVAVWREVPLATA